MDAIGERGAPSLLRCVLRVVGIENPYAHDLAAE